MNFDELRDNLILEREDESCKIDGLRKDVKYWMQKRDSIQADLDYLIVQFNGAVAGLKDAKKHLVDCQAAHYKSCCKHEALSNIIKILDDDLIDWNKTIF